MRSDPTPSMETHHQEGGFSRPTDLQKARSSQQQEQLGDDTSTHVSLAAMSTDDISSMGDTFYTGTTAGSRRKRKDDCSGTITSEESARSRSRRRRSRSDRPQNQRWMDGRAAESHAPIRPKRSDDDCFFPPLPRPPSTEAATGTSASCFATGYRNSFSCTLPNPGANPLHGHSLAKDTAAAREVARCQSMSLPPVRPTRTRDDSKTDLMEDTSSTTSKNNDEDEKDEFDPDMFARLLRGQQVMATLAPPSLTSSRSGGSLAVDNSSADPPKQPRRRSDADIYREHSHSSPNLLKRYNNVASSYRECATRTCPQKCTSMRDSCSHGISPKPPARPFRTFDENVLESAGPELQDFPIPELPTLLPRIPRVSEGTMTLGQKMASEAFEDVETNGSQEQEINASSNPMDLEQPEEEGVEVLLVEKRGGEGLEDESLVPASVKEYDAEMFHRLLKGESCSNAGDQTDIPGTGTSDDTNEHQHVPQTPLLLTKGSMSSAKTGITEYPGYDRFDNSVPCAVPEHLEGAMKSSHPPMRPRRSFDEGMVGCKDVTLSLANAAAVACVAGATIASSEGITVAPTRTVAKRRFCIVGTKRRFVCRRPSRRATLDLASELPPQNTTESAGLPSTDEAYDPTQEADLAASFDCGEIDDRDEYEIRSGGPRNSQNSDGSSYPRILPARRHRRVVRRFTMPSKGGTMSPISKKRRTIGRSMSCRTSEDEMSTPAA